MDLDDAGLVATGVAYVVLAWLPWYETHGGEVSLRGWDLGVVAVLAILLAGYAGARVVFLRFRPQRPEVPLSPAAEPFAASFAALLLTAYRVLDVPDLGGLAAERTTYLTIAGIVVVAQVAFASHKLSRTGFRAPPP